MALLTNSRLAVDKEKSEQFCNPKTGTNAISAQLHEISEYGDQQEDSLQDYKYTDKQCSETCISKVACNELGDQDLTMRDPDKDEMGDQDLTMRDPDKDEMGDQDLTMRDPDKDEMGDQDLTMRDPDKDEMGDQDLMMRDPDKDEMGDQDLMMRNPDKDEMGDQDLMMRDPDKDEMGDQDLMMGDPDKDEMGDQDLMMRDPDKDEMGDQDLTMGDPDKDEMGDQDLTMRDPDKDEMLISQFVARFLQIPFVCSSCIYFNIIVSYITSRYPDICQFIYSSNVRAIELVIWSVDMIGGREKYAHKLTTWLGKNVPKLEEDLTMKKTVQVILTDWLRWIDPSERNKDNEKSVRASIHSYMEVSVIFSEFIFLFTGYSSFITIKVLMIKYIKTANNLQNVTGYIYKLIRKERKDVTDKNGLKTSVIKEQPIVADTKISLTPTLKRSRMSVLQMLLFYPFAWSAAIISMIFQAYKAILRVTVSMCFWFGNPYIGTWIILKWLVSIFGMDALITFYLLWIKLAIRILFLSMVFLPVISGSVLVFHSVWGLTDVMD